jgi:hypothetical protein
MEDMRKKALPVKGHFITAGYQVDEESVKEMLTFMGVPEAESFVQEAIGFCSKNGMEVNMNNLYEFLKGKQIMSVRKDMRVKKN